MVSWLLLSPWLASLGAASDPPPPVDELPPVVPADELPPAEELPLAIPVEPPVPADPPMPTDRVTIRPPNRQIADPSASARALRTYRDGYLTVRSYSEIMMGTTTSLRWRHRPRARRRGWVTWSTPWAYQVETVGVFRGEQRLDVPETLEILGDTAGQTSLQRRIDRQMVASTVLQAVGVVGVSTLMVGLVGRDQSNSLGEFRSWEWVTLTGVGMSVGGFVLSAIPSRRATTLQFTHEETFELDALRHQVSDHNEALAAELGLDPVNAVGRTPPGP